MESLDRRYGAGRPWLLYSYRIFEEGEFEDQTGISALNNVGEFGSNYEALSLGGQHYYDFEVGLADTGSQVRF